MNLPETQPDPSTEDPPRHDSPSWADPFTAGRIIGLIAIFLMALYPGVILGSHGFFARDFGLFTYPVADYTHECFQQGAVPLWNPLNNSGVPFLAQWNTTVCYPLSLIYILLPLPWSLNFFCLGHLLLAGAGMYWLAYRWTQNRFAAGIAALAFALNGLMLNCLIWTSNLAALSWLPWVILLAGDAWKMGGGKIAAAALAGAMQMLAGAPEIILFTWIFLAALCLGEMVQGKIPPGRTARRFFILVLLIAGLSAVQMLPFFDLLIHSERDSSYVTADAWPMPLWGWANYVVPLFHCSPTVMGSFYPYGQSWTLSYYPGIGVLALALAGIRHPGGLKVRLLGGAALAGLVLALGNNGFVYAWLKHFLPLIGFARYPIKFTALPAFAIPLLTAFGVKKLAAAPLKNPGRAGRPLVIAGVFLLLSAVAILIAAALFPKPHDSWPMTRQDGLCRILFLLVTVGALIALGRVTAIRRRVLIGFAVLMLVGLDLTTAGMRINPDVSIKAFRPLTLNVSARPQYGQSRAMLNRQAQDFLVRADTPDPVYYFAGVRGALFENCNILENIPKVDGFCSLHLKNEMTLLNALYNRTNAFPAPLLDFLGVSQITSPDDTFAWQQRESFLPLVTAGQQPVFADETDTLNQILSENFDPRHVVYLPLSARSEIAATHPSPAKIVSPQFAAQRIRLHVEAAAPAMVVIAQSYYHDWRAYVDGKPARLWPANYAFQALEVPAGQHEIMLCYVDWAFRIGVAISALTLAGCLAALSLGGWRKGC
jgi:membrane protein YfhO